MNKTRSAFTLLVLALTLLGASGCGEPEIMVKGVTFEPSTMLKRVGSSFMFIINDGRGDDVLEDCIIKEHPSAHVMLHDFENGKMITVKEIRIPARKTTELKKGGLHIMFAGLPDEMEDEITLVLKFTKSGAMEVKAKKRVG